MVHAHDDHSDGHDHDHDHTHVTDDHIGRNLYQQIDRDNVIALNANPTSPPAKVIKPWHQRNDETAYLVSDADDQLILRVPFTASIKLRAILLKAGPDDQTPTQMSLFPNNDNLDFSDVGALACVQEIPLVVGREVVEYTVKASKFANIRSLSILFPASRGADTSQIYYVGFLGEWQELTKDAPQTIVYESNARPIDHEKIPGTEAERIKALEAASNAQERRTIPNAGENPSSYSHRSASGSLPPFHDASFDDDAAPPNHLAPSPFLPSGEQHKTLISTMQGRHSVTSSTSARKPPPPPTALIPYENVFDINSRAQRTVGLSGSIVAHIWSWSQLPAATLRDIWNEVDPTGQGSLDRRAFSVGMWRIDQEISKSSRSHPPSIIY